MFINEECSFNIHGLQGSGYISDLTDTYIEIRFSPYDCDTVNTTYTGNGVEKYALYVTKSTEMLTTTGTEISAVVKSAIDADIEAYITQRRLWYFTVGALALDPGIEPFICADRYAFNKPYKYLYVEVLTDAARAYYRLLEDGHDANTIMKIFNLTKSEIKLLSKRNSDFFYPGDYVSFTFNGIKAQGYIQDVYDTGACVVYDPFSAISKNLNAVDSAPIWLDNKKLAKTELIHTYSKAAAIRSVEEGRYDFARARFYLQLINKMSDDIKLPKCLSCIEKAIHSGNPAHAQFDEIEIYFAHVLYKYKKKMKLSNDEIKSIFTLTDAECYRYLKGAESK